MRTSAKVCYPAPHRPFRFPAPERTWNAYYVRVVTPEYSPASDAGSGTALRTSTGVVRRATVDDAAETAWLAALTFPLACPPGTPPSDRAVHIAHKLTPGHFREWATSAEHALLVHDDGTRLLGYVLLVLGTPDSAAETDAVRTASGLEAPYVELSKIYVHPDVLGGGVAGALMRGAIEAAAELGPGLPLWLGTNARNERAQAFYRKSGFEVVGTRTYRVGDLEHDDVVLLRTEA